MGIFELFKGKKVETVKEDTVKAEYLTVLTEKRVLEAKLKHVKPTAPEFNAMLDAYQVLEAKERAMRDELDAKIHAEQEYLATKAYAGAIHTTKAEEKRRSAAAEHYETFCVENDVYKAGHSSELAGERMDLATEAYKSTLKKIKEKLKD